MKLKFTFRQHRKFCEQQLADLVEKRRVHNAKSLEQFPQDAAILQLTEQVEVFRNLEYIGTPDGKPAPIQATLFG